MSWLFRKLIPKHTRFQATWQGGTLVRFIRESKEPMFGNLASWINQYEKDHGCVALELAEFTFKVEFRKV